MKTPRNFKISIRSVPGLVIAIAATFGPIAAWAQAPTGFLQYTFTAENGVPLWNFSGSYATPYYSMTNDTLLLHHFGKGNLFASYQGDPAGGAVEGIVRGANSNLRVKLSSRMFSISEFTNNTQQETAMQRNDTLALTFDSAARSLNGTDRVVIKSVVLVPVNEGFFPGNRWKTMASYTFTQPVSLLVPETTDGRWSLELNITTIGNKLTGTGLIGFNNSETFQFQLSGTYLPKTQKTRILLKGQGEDKGANLVISLAGPETKVERMSGRVGGQRIRYPAQ